MAGTLKTKTAKQVKQDLLDSFQAIGGKNKLIASIKADLNKGDSSTFWNLIHLCGKFVPKEVDIRSDNRIQIELDIPNAITEDNKAISNSMDKAIVEDIVVDSVSIDDDTSTTIVDDTPTDSV